MFFLVVGLLFHKGAWNCNLSQYSGFTSLDIYENIPEMLSTTYPTMFTWIETGHLKHKDSPVPLA